jgi:hypothetical protein
MMDDWMGMEWDWDVIGWQCICVCKEGEGLSTSSKKIEGVCVWACVRIVGVGSFGLGWMCVCIDGEGRASLG